MGDRASLGASAPPVGKSDCNQLPSAARKPNLMHAVEPTRGPDGDPVNGLILDALAHAERRRAQSHDPQTGQWTSANGGRLETGVHSVDFWQALEPARALIEQRVRQQLGLTDGDGCEVASGVIGAYAEADLIRRSEFFQLTRLQPEPAATAKQRRRQADRRRRHLQTWGLAFDRFMKAAVVLGLERKARRVPNLAEYLAAKAEDPTS